MSTSNTVSHHDGADGFDAPAGPAALPRFESPIVPKATISGRALVAVVAIMTFLASLTTGAVVLVRSAANEWQADVAREVSIQIRPTGGRDIEADMARAAAIARDTPGVAEVRAYSKNETTRLLEPWLGSGIQIDELPIPRLVVVRIAPGSAPDLSQLRQALAEAVPDASLDDHRGFVARMQAISGALVLAGIGVLVLVFIATVLSAMFATRAAIAANRSVIEVLHLIGAKDKFIAGHFERHFLRLGLQGGLIGGGAGLALFALASLASGSVFEASRDDQLGALFGSFSIGARGYVAVLSEIALIALVTAATSRWTVTRTIESIHE
jgi:cell division transport system permease protein